MPSWFFISSTSKGHFKNQSIVIQGKGVMWNNELRWCDSEVCFLRFWPWVWRSFFNGMFFFCLFFFKVLSQLGIMEMLIERHNMIDGFAFWFRNHCTRSEHPVGGFRNCTVNPEQCAPHLGSFDRWRVHGLWVLMGHPSITQVQKVWGQTCQNCLETN